MTLGPYAFGSDIDITGIAKEGATINPNGGGEADDDALFEKLVKDLEPYVASSTHTFENTDVQEHPLQERGLACGASNTWR